MGPINIAVIGSGIGAASACYHIKKLFRDENVNIEVFEAEGAIGGRTKATEIDGKSVELGASIAYTGNKYMSHWTNEFNLTRKKSSETKFGLWNGSKFVFMESDYGVLTLCNIIWRYGYDFFAMRKSVLHAVKQFDKIYPAQENGMIFDTPAALWSYIGLLHPAQQTFSDHMRRVLNAPDSPLLHELLHSVNKVNYNQGNDINALAGLVSLCPLVSGKVFSTKEGWTQIHKSIFDKTSSRIHLLHRITHIRNIPGATHGDKYTLSCGKNELPTRFDAVVIAVPLEEHKNIEVILNHHHVDMSKYYKGYQTTITTFIKGKLLASAFNDSVLAPSAVYFTQEAEKRMPMSSIGRYWVSEGSKDAARGVYKVFSTEPLSVDTLQKYFSSDSTIVATHKWHAYPVYSTFTSLHLPFQLHKDHHVYSSSVLEGAVSAMEISAIGGRNVAIMLQKHLSGNLSSKPV